MSRATCHPERPKYRKNGLCAPCWRRTPEGRAAWKAYLRDYRRKRYRTDQEFRRRHLEAVKRSRAKRKGGSMVDDDFESAQEMGDSE